MTHVRRATSLTKLEALLHASMKLAWSSSALGVSLGDPECVTRATKGSLLTPSLINVEAQSARSITVSIATFGDQKSATNASKTMNSIERRSCARTQSVRRPTAMSALKVVSGAAVIDARKATITT